MDRHINFSKRTIDALSLPGPGKRETYYDAKTPGLGLRITEKGTRSFVVYRKLNGKPERVTIGRYPAVTIEQARKKAAEINAAFADGKNPNDQKREIREEMTLRELHELFIEQYAKVHKRTWETDKTRYKTHLAPWNNKKLSQIRKTDIQGLHARIGRDSGIYAANRVLALLSTMFNKAREWGWKYENPAKGIRKFKEQSRDRFLEADELPKFFKALSEEPNAVIRDFFFVSLFTGARRANVLEMRWDQLNLERGTWEIPETKSGESHTIPLVSGVLAILESRKEESDSPWVFPGTGKSGHLVEPKKTWRRILERAGIENLRIHDLRRSLGSWQAATGANLSIIGKTLAHKNVSTTAIYARLNLDPVRESMKKATDAMLQAGGLLEKGDVIQIKK